MKRNWKIALLVPFIILCIGTYYIDAASNSYPDYYLKLQAGDEKEVSGISIQANYTNQSLTINSNGSVYKSEESFWSSLDSRYYRSPEIAKLKKEYPQFMRGKDDPSSLYEDDEVLGYAEIESKYILQKGHYDYQFIISTYDKKQKRGISFKVLIPQENNYPTIRLNEVQIVGQTMNLITINTKDNEAKAANAIYAEVHLYKLDLNKQNIALDQVIITSGSANDPIEIRYVFETALTEPNRYLVFQVKYSKKQKLEAASGFNSTGIQGLVYYDLENSKLVPIQVESINDLMKKSNDLTITYSQDELLLTNLKNPNAVRVIKYSLAENKVKSDLTIDTKYSQADGERLTFALNARNRLYMMGSLKNDFSGESPTLVIADLDKGSILYEGYISCKDNQAIRNLMTRRILVQ